MKSLVTKLTAALKKAVGNNVDLVQGPFVPPALGGLRPTVFVAVRSFQDDGGITADDRRTVRWPRQDGKPGYVEARPGRLAVSIDCIALSHVAVTECCEAVIPVALAALGALTSVSLGSTAERNCSLEFRDFSASVHSMVFQMEPDKDKPFSHATIVFQLEGFLQAEILRQKVRTLPKPTRRTKAKTPSRAVRERTGIASPRQGR